MSIEVRLPDLGDSVTHAKLTTWLKREGDPVSRGEPIVEVETDKTSVEIEAPSDGILAMIHVREGTDRVPIHALLASIALEGTTVPAAPADAGDPPRTGRPTTTGIAATVPHLDAGQSTAPANEAALAPARPQNGAAATAEADIAASPLARRMAQAAGISLGTIPGTGPNGRITKEDVDAVVHPGRRSDRGLARPSRPLADPVPPYDVHPLSAMRRVTADRLAHAKQTIPHFYLRIDCALDRVSLARQELNAGGRERFSLTAFIIRAAALALQRVPAANSAWVDGAVRVYKAADISLAVNTPSGLIAPVIRQAEQKSLLAIAREVQTLTERARQGRLQPEDYSGGTFTISNLGMYGVTSLYPIINPPQSCILGIGAVEERAVVRDHAVTVGLVMTCTLSADHRAIDGASGAALLAAFRELIDDPWALLL